MTPTTMTSPVAPLAFTPTPAAPLSATASATTLATAPASEAILGTYKRQAPLFVRGQGVYMYDDNGTR